MPPPRRAAVRLARRSGAERGGVGLGGVGASPLGVGGGLEQRGLVGEGGGVHLGGVGELFAPPPLHLQPRTPARASTPPRARAVVGGGAQPRRQRARAPTRQSSPRAAAAARRVGRRERRLRVVGVGRATSAARVCSRSRCSARCSRRGAARPPLPQPPRRATPPPPASTPPASTSSCSLAKVAGGAGGGGPAASARAAAPRVTPCNGVESTLVVRWRELTIVRPKACEAGGSGLVAGGAGGAAARPACVPPRGAPATFARAARRARRRRRLERARRRRRASGGGGAARGADGGADGSGGGAAVATRAHDALAGFVTRADVAASAAQTAASAARTRGVGGADGRRVARLRLHRRAQRVPARLAPVRRVVVHADVERRARQRGAARTMEWSAASAPKVNSWSHVSRRPTTRQRRGARGGAAARPTGRRSGRAAAAHQGARRTLVGAPWASAGPAANAAGGVRPVGSFSGAGGIEGNSGCAEVAGRGLRSRAVRSRSVRAGLFHRQRGVTRARPRLELTRAADVRLELR